MVARAQFRSDLYYRLNVFPILLPALRERREDIPALVAHFVKMFNRRMGKQVDSIPPETMAAFQWHSWPGNIRELQNLVERAVILTRDGVLPNPLPTAVAAMTLSPATEEPPRAPDSAPTTLRESERALIVQTLQATGWKIGGPKGAALKLGLNRTTLMYKMKKLGLERPPRRAASPDNLTTAGLQSPAGIPLPHNSDSSALASSPE